jgi:hypothetical protein
VRGRAQSFDVALHLGMKPRARPGRARAWSLPRKRKKDGAYPFARLSLASAGCLAEEAVGPDPALALPSIHAYRMIDVIDVIEQVVTAMDVSNPDTWKQQWTAFTSAAYIVAPLIVFSGSVGWWIGRIAGLNGRISVFEDRLKLAAEQAESARQAKDEVATEFETYKAEVAAEGENATVGASAARVEGAIVRFAAANNTLSEILGVPEKADIVNFRRQVPRGADALSPSPNWRLRRSARLGRSVLKTQSPFSVGPT